MRQRATTVNGLAKGLDALQPSHPSGNRNARSLQDSAPGTRDGICHFSVFVLHRGILTELALHTFLRFTTRKAAMAYLLAILYVLCIQYSSAQTTTRLPPPPKYNGGIFNTPDTAKTQQFSLGSTMNVSWSTQYPSINLYLIFNAEYDSPRTLLFGSTRASYEWEVDDNGNNTRPFSFRIVNAEGTNDDLIGGGFYTGQFWVRRESVDTTTSSTSSVPVTTTSSIEESTKTSSIASTGSGSSSSSISMSSTPPVTSSTPLSTPTDIEPLNKPVETAADAPEERSGDGTNTTAIGVGVGVGAGVAVAALIIATWLFCRISRRKKNAKQQQPPETQAMVDPKDTRQLYEAWAQQHQEMQGSQTVHEFFAAKSPVEANSTPVRAWELQGSVVEGRK
ncbi:hypothetical protein Q7P37_007334 [Cladosporium fusiforme]